MNLNVSLRQHVNWAHVRKVYINLYIYIYIQRTRGSIPSRKAGLGLIMYMLTTLEFPNHNHDFHLLTTSVNIYIYIYIYNYIMFEGKLLPITDQVCFCSSFWCILFMQTIYFDLYETTAYSFSYNLNQLILRFNAILYLGLKL